MAEHKAITPGTRFSRLVVVRHVYIENVHRYVCKCDCGTETTVRYCNLKSGKTTSCGCLRQQLNAKKGNHRHTFRGGCSRTYQSWRAMHRRCNGKAQSSKHYLGRGIKVCERWHTFANFLADMGERPEGMTLDRVDNNGHYEPGNCRWADANEQARNKRWTVHLTLGDETHCLTDWSEKLGVGVSVLYGRVRRGWSDEKVLTTPQLPRKRSH